MDKENKLDFDFDFDFDELNKFESERQPENPSKTSRTGKFKKLNKDESDNILKSNVDNIIKIFEDDW